MPVVDSDYPEKVKSRIPHEPWLYMANNWKHPNAVNRPYDFHDTSGDQKLDYLLDSDSPLYANNWGNINVLLWARGCLKSTTVLGIIEWLLATYPKSEVLMAAPRESQVHEFVRKFKERTEESGFVNQRVKNKMSHQKFEHDLPGQGSVYSQLMTASAWGDGDASRGYHTHVGIIDEFQDVDEATFSTFFEAIDREMGSVDYFPSIFVIGTPKMANSFFEELWEDSDQKTWDADAGEWEAKQEAAEYKPPDAPDEMDGYSIRGWKIDQYNHPLHDPSKIEMSRSKYSERKFQNEVLANFYTPEDDLLSESDVINCLDEEIEFRDRRRWEDSYVTVGVDWGGGEDEKAAYTAMCVAEHIQNDDGNAETYILDIDFIDKNASKDEEMKALEEKILKYDVDRAVVDEGYASKRREDLQNGTGTMDESGYADLLSGCRFGNVQNKSGVTWADGGRFFTVDKSHTIEQVVDQFKREKIHIPSSLSFGSEDDVGTRMLDQLTAPYKQKKETPSGTKKIRVKSDRNDDAMDAFTYAIIAHRKVGNTGPTVGMTSHNRHNFDDDW